ncbi:MAG: phosphatidate phosphatase App1 family protein, partial [Myxococcota bacterium]
GALGVVYVSGSPLALFPRITHFLRRHGIPEGPLLLKNYGTDPFFEQRQYKRRHLEVLLDRLPASRLLLVGDSGEHDPEIYAELRRDHPTRVAGIVIRRVPGDTSPISRFAGMTVVDDFHLASMPVSASLLPPTAVPRHLIEKTSEGEASTEGDPRE